MAKAPKVSKAQTKPKTAKKPIAPKRKPGNQTTFNHEIAKVICKRLADGETLRKICRDEGMPPRTTVLEWVLDNREGFAVHYARAREIGYHEMADEVIEISDNASAHDAVDPSTVQRDKLRVDTRKWLLSKALPKIYGDKIQVGGDEDSPVKVEVTHVRDGISRKLCRIASTKGAGSVAE